MSDKPILFSAPMVRAILDWRKTQTRRVVKAAALARLDGGKCPYGAVGGTLWVREPWGKVHNETAEWSDKHYVYRADNGQTPEDNGGPAPWRPSIHMPRAASRITLEITGIRVERLQDISEDDAMAEGAPCCVMDDDGKFYERDDGTHYCGFAGLWSSINGAESWETNPVVWVVSFKML